MPTDALSWRTESKASSLPSSSSPFKAAAVAYLGRFEGGGLLRDGGIGGARVFVLLGPMEATASAEAKITTLRSLLGS
jgi:hypothetical protein